MPAFSPLAALVLGDLGAIEVDRQVLSLAADELDRSLFVQRLAVLVQLNNDFVAIPGLAGGQAGGGELADLARLLRFNTGQRNLGVGRYMDRQAGFDSRREAMALAATTTPS